MVKALVAVLKQALFIGDKMIPSHWKGMPEERKQVLNMLESRSSELAFIAKQIQQADPDPSPIRMKDSPDREEKEDLTKIMEVNTTLHRKANQDERDKLILDNLPGIREKIRFVGLESDFRRSRRCLGRQKLLA